MSPIPQLLRLLILLLTPFWLSLAVEGLGLYGSMPSLLSSWRRPADVDTTTAQPTGWRERAYLAANPDVAAAVRSGQVSSGYAHYVQQGRAEGRRGGFVEQAKKPAEHHPATSQPTAPPTGPAQTDPAPAFVPAPPLPAAKPEPQDGAPALRTEPAVEILRPGVKPVPDAPARASGIQTVASTAAPRHVERIRTANGGDGLRVVLDLDQDPRFETPVRRPDGRLEVTLPGTQWQAAPTGRLPATALGYRAEQNGSGTRLLFSDEDGGTDGKGDAVRLLAVSTLPPDKDRGHRLVIDLVLPSMAKADRKAR
ncbi:hypothetical protein J2848_005859 [Azospirillum lipoferum]|uniref:Uncharacterized protein n=1 Tax=Azospirillum lipoferum TaxID=193 RepID=A0A5A9GJB2_AZOLI|nr:MULTISPECIES: hypothetical protein [Azospirillum]KAA0593792.1 hypothetical protein FZ942_23170 [Azospirillum lipoferum]MCP1614156.1 hypothetical protein [Azospirillum lipoferum]MDW5536842.1 hypothetical protein [Azospirillum sp. NL1]